MNEVKMKMQWAQVLLVVLTMSYLSTCERDSRKSSDRVLLEKIDNLAAEIRRVKSEGYDSNCKLFDIKLEISRLRSDMNAHNLKMQRKTL